jgi:dTDP-glucose 4,6-dehydratase
MKILVTGGAGFIGSNFLHYMSNKYPSYELVCLDKLTYAGNLRNINELISSLKVHFIKGDISDKDFIRNLFNNHQFDYVVNFAAESHVDRSISNPQEFLLTNYMGVFNLLEEIKQKPNIKFHQVSTDEVYGDLPLDSIDLLFDEQTKFNPSSPYSASKAAADLLVNAYNRTYKLYTTISHCSNNYGPYQFPEKLIPLVVSKARDNLSIPVYGNGLNVRDWIHVFDHCSALDLIMHKGKSGETYNIGAESERSNISIVRDILNLMGKSNNLIEYVQDRAGHDLRYAVDITKISSQTGWKPSITLQQGLKDTIDWYLSNYDWLKKLSAND